MSNDLLKSRNLADRYVAELMDGGHAIDPGQFTMDREVAREKLSELGLPDPYFYALLLIRSASLRGAGHMEVQTDVRGLQLRFNGDPFDRPELEALYDVAMGSQTDSRSRSLRVLALGLRTASCLEGFLSVDVVSGNEKGCTRLCLEAGRGETLEDAPPGLRGTAIAIRFHGRSANEAPEVEVLEKRCGYAESEIYVNGRDITQGLRLRLDEAVLPTTFEQDGVRGAAGFVPEQEHTAELRLVHDGVLLATHELDVVDTRFAVVVDAGQLQLDLSQFDVIRDEAYERLVQVVQQIYTTSMDRKAAGSACKHWLEKQATSRLNQLDALRGGRALRWYASSAAICGLVHTIPILVMVATDYRHTQRWTLITAGLFVLIMAATVVFVATSARLEQPTVELAAQLLPVGSKVRAAAVAQAQRRGGAMARILR